MATYQNAIDDARLSLNDDDKTRYPDPECFIYAKDGVREVAYMRPDLFVTAGTLTCVANQPEQSVAGLDPVGLYVLDVLGVVGGDAITKADLDTLRRMRPSWWRDAAAAAQNWFVFTDDQSKRPQARFYLYPKAPANQIVVVQYVYDPVPSAASVTIASAMPLQDSLTQAIANYVVYRCELKDDEHVVNQRAQAGYQNFMQCLGVSEKARKMVVQEGLPQ